MLSTMRLVLAGRTGAGKSSTGNTILGRRVFREDVSSASVTSLCQKHSTNRWGRYLEVLDTPGMFDTTRSQSDVMQELGRCVSLTLPGPHAFILTVRVDRFTAEDRETCDEFFRQFGQDARRVTVLVFTHKDDLDFHGKSIESFVQDTNAELKSLLDSCGNRYVAFNNLAPTDGDVQRLLSIVDNMVGANGGVHYTNDMYRAAEAARRAEEEMVRHDEEERKEAERRRLEEEARQMAVQEQEARLAKIRAESEAARRVEEERVRREELRVRRENEERKEVERRRLENEARQRAVQEQDARLAKIRAEGEAAIRAQKERLRREKERVRREEEERNEAERRRLEAEAWQRAVQEQDARLAQIRAEEEAAAHRHRNDNCIIL